MEYLIPQNSLLSKNRQDSFFRKKKRQSIHLKFDDLGDLTESKLSQTLEKMGAFESDYSDPMEDSARNTIFNQMSEELSPQSAGNGSFGSMEEFENGKKKSSFGIMAKRVENEDIEIDQFENSRRTRKRSEGLIEDFVDEDMEEEPNYKFGGGN